MLLWRFLYAFIFIYLVYVVTTISSFRRGGLDFGYNIGRQIIPKSKGYFARHAKINGITVSEKMYSNAAKAGLLPYLQAFSRSRGTSTKAADALLEKLMQLGAADTDVFDGSSVLHFAASIGLSEIVVKLVEAGYDINQQDNLFYSPLMTAVEGGHEETVNRLLDLGAELLMFDENRNSALHLACSSIDSPKIVAKIMEYNDGSLLMPTWNFEMDTPLMVAVNAGHEGSVSKMMLMLASLEKEPGLGMLFIKAILNDLHKTTGFSVLHVACFKGFSRIAVQLITAGADVNKRSRCGSTPLMMAVYEGHADTVSQLLKYGADVNAVRVENESLFSRFLFTVISTVGKFSRGDSALHFACDKGFSKIIEKLVDSGSYLNQRNYDGNTPLMLAVKSKNWKAVNLMLDLGADISFFNDKHQSALDIAILNGFDDIADIISRKTIASSPPTPSSSSSSSSSSSAVTVAPTRVEKVHDTDSFMERYSAVVDLLDNPIVPLTWTQIALEQPSSDWAVEAEAEAREMREDDLAQRALIATLQSGDDVVLTDDSQYNDLPAAIEADPFDEEEEGYDHDIDASASSKYALVHNIEWSKATLDWWNRAKGEPKKLFRNRMLKLAEGRHSNTLSKRLQNSAACTIFESKLLFGHRVLWSKVKRGSAFSILVWCVSTHQDVNRRIKLISQSYSHLTSQSPPGTSSAVNWLDLTHEEMLLDPLGKTPIKIYNASGLEKQSTASNALNWVPPLILSNKQGEINLQQGTVLLHGSSGTGKTQYLVNRMQSDAHSAAGDRRISQLFVCRSSRLCEHVQYLYHEGGENEKEDDSSLSRRRIDFQTLDAFISHMETVSGPHQKLFSKKQRADFPYFRNKFFPIIAKKKDFVDPLIVWTQIKSYLKGSVEAALLGRSLRLEEYLDLDSFSENRCRLSKEMRIKAFQIFELYENDLKEKNMWDDCDRIMDLLKKYNLRNQQADTSGGGNYYDRVYVDEIQDCTQAEICLFFVAAGFEVQSLFLVGDPAQAVVEGVDFRFEEVRSIVHKLSQRKETLHKATSLTTNFRSHGGILNCSSAVLDILDVAFPGSVKKSHTEFCYPGPKPAYYMLDSTTGGALLDLRDILGGNERTVVVCRDEIIDEVQSMSNDRYVWGIRVAKGLEFSDVVLVNFFHSIPSSDQRIWKLMLEAELAGTTKHLMKLLQKHLQVEMQLKLLYTGMGRSRNSLLFVETKTSVAGRAFFSWLQAKQLADPFDISSSKSERDTLTLDEWRTRGLDLARSADGPSSIPKLIEAVKCFEKAKSAKFLHRASAELEFHLLMQRLEDREVASTGGGSTSMTRAEEEEVAELIETMLQNHLHAEVKILCEIVKLTTCNPAKFNQYIVLRL